MAKLTYWIANRTDDHPCYSIRRRTKRQVVAEVASGLYAGGFTVPKKVTIEYADAFDLMDQCLTGEDAGYWEHRYDASPKNGP